MAAAIGSNQNAAPVLWALVVDGMGLRPLPSGEAARVETRVVPNPHDDAIYVRAREVPITHTRDAAASLGEISRGTRVPGVT